MPDVQQREGSLPVRLIYLLTLLTVLLTTPSEAQVLYTGRADPSAVTTVPSNSIGVENSYYWDQASGYTYGPKTLGQWPTTPSGFIFGNGSYTIPPTGNTLLNLSYGGWPINQPGALTVNRITITANQPLTGTTTPGQPNSQTVNGLRIQNNILGPDPGGQWLGYKGAEYKGLSVILAVQSPLTTQTDNHKGDLVAGTFATTSSYDMEDQTQYNMSNASTCLGPASPYPSASFPAGQNCWNRQMVHIENDNQLDAVIPWAAWPGTVSGNVAISTVAYSAANAGYNNLPTLTYTLTQSLPARMVRDFTNNPYNVVTGVGSKQYTIVQLATAEGDATMPNPHDPFGHDTVTYPPIANPNYNATFRPSTNLIDRWLIYFISNDGKTVVTAGPPNPGGNGFGTLDFFWLGYARANYSLNLINQGDANAGSEAAVNIQGGWWYGLRFDTTRINGVPTAAVDVHGALMASDSKSSIGNILYFPCNNTTNIFNIGGLTATGVNWCANSVTRPYSSMSYGQQIIYGPSAPAPTVNPVATLPVPGGTDIPTPISEGADFDQPGVNNCPAGINGQCQIRYQGNNLFDVPWYGTVGNTPTNFCNGGTVLFGNRTGTGTVRLTTDGNAANGTNTLNLNPNFKSQTGTINVDMQEQSGSHSEGFIIKGLFFSRKAGGVDAIATDTITHLDPDTNGGSLSVTDDATNHGVNITATVPAGYTLSTTVTACAFLAHAQ